MADSKKAEKEEAPPRRRRIVVHELEGQEAAQIEMCLGDPIKITDPTTGRKYLQFRIA